MESTQRLHFVDNLRSFALLLGIVFHAALAYGPFFENIWLTASPHPSVFYDYIALTLHLFRMPLFFVIAGFCAALLIAKRGTKAYLMHRIKRILIPLLVFLPICGAMYVHALTWGATVATPAPPIFSVINQMKEPAVSTMHLWFLWYLFIFSFGLWACSLFNRFYDGVLSLSVHPITVFIALPVVITLAMQNLAVPFPAADKVIPQLWALGFYGPLFLVGAGLYHHLNKIKQLTRYLPYIVIISSLSIGIYFYVLPQPPTIEQVLQAATTGALKPNADGHFLIVVSQTMAIFLTTTLALVSGYKWLNKENKISRYFSDASYWVYIIHLPIMLYIQMVLVTPDISVHVKFVISVVLTLILSLASYQMFVRKTPIGRLLNGKKSGKESLPTLTTAKH